jgi:PAS domain S-box-containing protein
MEMMSKTGVSNSMQPISNKPKARKRVSAVPENLEDLENEEHRLVFHRLSTQQLLLEKQNEALQRAQEDLKLERTRYLELYNMAPVGYCTLSDEGLILAANLTLSALLGVSQHDLINQPFVQYIHPEDRESIRFQQADTGGCLPQVYELRMVRSDGSAFWACLASNTSQEHRVVKKCRLTISDISELKRTKEILAHNERQMQNTLALLKKVIDTLQFGVYWKDLVSTYLGCNLRFAKDAGLDVPEELIGFDDFHIHSKERADMERQDDLEVIQSGIAKLSREEIVTLPAGAQRRYSRSKYPLYDENGVILGLVGVDEDITDQKLAEEEILKSRKNELVSLIFKGIAHDFNKIILPIMENISSAKRQIPQSNAAWIQLTKAENSVLETRDLTRQFAVLSEREIPVNRLFSLANLVQPYSHFLLSGTLSTCELSIPETLWMVDGDEGLLRQAFANILINASQAMPNGGQIKIICENVHIDSGDMLPLKEGRYVKIEIQDQGEGIPDERLEKIFDPYFTTKESCRGMGLPLVLAIIKKHHGHITVQTSIGAGTTFIAYLPASEETDLQKNSEHQEIQPCKGKILIMDDDEILLNMVGIMLAHLGYKAECALDGQEAIEKYSNALRSEEPFDAVIIDLVVPIGMGGKEAMQTLLEIDPQVKGIISSGYIHNSIIEDYEHYGFKDVLIKPYRVSDLEKVLARLCNK